MPASNEITGDRLVSKPPSEEYSENYDKIFKKSRIDIVGQNGNCGSHYEQLELPLNDYPDNSKDA